VARLVARLVARQMLHVDEKRNNLLQNYGFFLTLSWHFWIKKNADYQVNYLDYQRSLFQSG
ncbi:MAG: hypothetical protein IIZ89_06915, partial [Muribaculaceae bacterium]|nr:hypothetical protein [Muribaculaceae bacterium]